MARLRKDAYVIAENLWIASNPWTRFKGLLGRKHLPENEAMWIKPCNGIHTFFMRFPIDAVFTDRNLVVKKVIKNIPPGRMPWPVWSATHTFEFAAGSADRHNLREGDRLHVDP